MCLWNSLNRMEGGQVEVNRWMELILLSCKSNLPILVTASHSSTDSPFKSSVSVTLRWTFSQPLHFDAEYLLAPVTSYYCSREHQRRTVQKRFTDKRAGLPHVRKHSICHFYVSAYSRIFFYIYIYIYIQIYILTKHLTFLPIYCMHMACASHCLVQRIMSQLAQILIQRQPCSHEKS